VQSGDSTILLQQCTRGNRQALDAITPIVYAELRRLAAACMRHERPGALQPTALIHETYLEPVGHKLPGFKSRAHSFGIAACIMRQLLIRSARRCQAQKRGGGNRANIPDDIPIAAPQIEELLSVDEALDRLARQDARKARVIELKCFGGLSREILEALGLTLATLKHDLAMGEVWLQRALSSKVAGKGAWWS
jgi:RNA polymerase sigma-70 factor (ECF subfamily)